MGLVTLLKSVQKGFLKNVLTGAGLTLGTSGVILASLNTAISHFKNATNSLPVQILGLAHLAGFDYFFSIILGAMVAKQIQNAGKLTLQKIK